jgi:ABC-2 type transport system ATP-binding protein
LLTTQYLDEADHLASQVVIIDHGRAVAAGTPAELKRRIGGNVVEVHLAHAADLPRVGEMLGRLHDGAISTDHASRRVTVSVDSGSDGLLRALRCIEEAGVALDDIAMRQPNLDEVFLALTGRPTEPGVADTVRAA